MLLRAQPRKPATDRLPTPATGHPPPATRHPPPVKPDHPARVGVVDSDELIEVVGGAGVLAGHPTGAEH
jgi:hypothetical protein